MAVNENLERLSRLIVADGWQAVEQAGRQAVQPAGRQVGLKAGEQAASRAELERLFDGCYGRIVRSRALPETLTEDKGRKLVMVMGADGLLSIAGLSPLAMLEKIGYPRQYVEEKMKDGTRFFLLLFQLGREEVLPATWSNVLSIAGRIYEKSSDILLNALDYLENTPYEKFEAEVGYRLCEVGEDDERFVGLDELLSSDCSPQMVRKFLYHTLRLNELFTGTGVTLTEQGLSGVREFVVADRKLTDLREGMLVELKVESASN